MGFRTLKLDVEQKCRFFFCLRFASFTSTSVTSTSVGGHSIGVTTSRVFVIAVIIDLLDKGLVTGLGRTVIITRG